MPKRISQAGDRTDGTLRCPKCGGTTFKAKRSGKRKSVGVLLALVFLPLYFLLPKNHVRCEACGETFKRG